MSVNTTVLAALAAACVGFVVFWANPKRALNRTFCTGSLHAALWLICRDLAMERGQYGQEWLRITTSVGAFLPFHLWVIKETIIMGAAESLDAVLMRGRWWGTASAGLAVLTFTQWFVPTRTGEEFPPFGPGYYAYIAGLLLVYALLCRETIVQLRSQLGVRRLELQIVLLGGSAVALTVIVLMAARAVFGLDWLTTLQPLAVFGFFALTAVAITTTRLMDARQILNVAAQRLSLLAGVAIVAYGVHRLLSLWLEASVAFTATVAIALSAAAFLSRWLNLLFRFYPQGISARQAVFSVAQREARVERLEKAFHSVLSGWGQTEHVVILSGSKNLLSGGGVEVLGDSSVLDGMRQLQWATPERLLRERRNPSRVAVAEFLEQHRLGVLVIEVGPALTVLVGVGVAASRRPYTYPQVTQLMELASIMESALERAHFSAKAQHSEQLATVGLLGANLAHEIRNPLVSIKTFVQLLPTHYQDPEFREKFFRLIGGEVERIDQLTEQLLDLASPRIYAAVMFELHAVLRASLDLVAAKAADKKVDFYTDFRAAPDTVFTDPAAAKQVMLNLCFNAIQAAESCENRERWIRIATQNANGGVEMAVSDSGPGIPPEMQQRLFQPFQTTKSTGFGLGLAICRDILANLHATISVDPSLPKQGATFRVTYPCQPSSS